jgi:hypothetical protein
LGDLKEYPEIGKCIMIFKKATYKYDVIPLNTKSECMVRLKSEFPNLLGEYDVGGLRGMYLDRKVYKLIEDNKNWDVYIKKIPRGRGKSFHMFFIWNDNGGTQLLWGDTFKDLTGREAGYNRYKNGVHHSMYFEICY